MSENTSSTTLSEQEIEARKELFRYTDLAHPVMQTLFEYTEPASQPVEKE
ncbi:MAG: hypothetical protein PSN44_00995 [Gammaproteobacteria bacterium]|nr:hypothetical protein [Gammaproteobacteria bacterium]